MNATIEKNTIIPRDEIARIAWQIWKSDGSPEGRDQEYWFKAEQRLLADRQPAKADLINANAKRRTPMSGQKKHPVRVWPDVMD